MIEHNITCPQCRFRHPASRSCAEAKYLADEARAAREERAAAEAARLNTFENTVELRPGEKFNGLEPLRKSFTEAELQDFAQRWLIANDGKPVDLRPDERKRWYERRGMLAQFVCDLWKGEAP